MKRFRAPLFTFFIVICATALVFTTAKLKALRLDLPMELVRGEALMVDPGLLKVVSGEFKGLLADYLLLKASIIDGGQPEKMSDQDWEAVYVLYKQSMALDPYFYQTAYYIQGNMAWREGMAAKSIELLKISADHRSWDWNPQWYIGFDYAHFLGDKVQAASYFFEAAKKPGAPEVLGILAARLAQGSGDTLTSITMLQAMIEQSENEEFKSTLGRRLQAHIGVYQLEQAIVLFYRKYGKLPSSLNALLDVGIISELPEHPYNEQYEYDPRTGRVDYGQSRN